VNSLPQREKVVFIGSAIFYQLGVVILGECFERIIGVFYELIEKAKNSINRVKDSFKSCNWLFLYPFEAILAYF
jgi:hypothetical protein